MNQCGCRTANIGEFGVDRRGSGDEDDIPPGLRFQFPGDSPQLPADPISPHGVSESLTDREAKPCRVYAVGTSPKDKNVGSIGSAAFVCSGEIGPAA